MSEPKNFFDKDDLVRRSEIAILTAKQEAKDAEITRLKEALEKIASKNIRTGLQPRMQERNKMILDARAALIGEE